MCVWAIEELKERLCQITPNRADMHERHKVALDPARWSSIVSLDPEPPRELKHQQRLLGTAAYAFSQLMMLGAPADEGFARDDLAALRARIEAGREGARQLCARAMAVLHAHADRVEKQIDEVVVDVEQRAARARAEFVGRARARDGAAADGARDAK